MMYNINSRCLVCACIAKRRQWLGEKCMQYEVEGARPGGRSKRTWREVVQKDCQAHRKGPIKHAEKATSTRTLNLVVWRCVPEMIMDRHTDLQTCLSL